MIAPSTSQQRAELFLRGFYGGWGDAMDMYKQQRAFEIQEAMRRREQEREERMRQQAWLREDQWRQQQFQAEQQWKEYLKTRDQQQEARASQQLALQQQQEQRQSEYQKELISNMREDNARAWMGLAGKAIGGIADKLGGAADWMLRAGLAAQAQRDKEIDNRRQALSQILSSIRADENALYDRIALARQAQRESSADISKMRAESKKIPGAAKGMEAQYIESARAVRELSQQLEQVREKRMALERELASMAGLELSAPPSAPLSTGMPPRKQNIKLPPTTQPKLAIPQNSPEQLVKAVWIGIPHGQTYQAPDGSIRVRDWAAQTWKDDPVWGTERADLVARPPMQLPADIQQANELWLQLPSGTRYIDPSGVVRVKR